MIKKFNDSQKDDSLKDNSLKDKTFNFIFNLMFFKNQLRINHWQTDIYSEHKITDDIMSTLNDTIDSMGEVTIGIFGKPIISKKQNELTDIKNSTSSDIINEICDQLNFLIIEYKKTDYECMVALLGELSINVSKYKYLLTFIK